MTIQPQGFSEEFLDLSSAEKRAKIEAAGGTDRSELPEEVKAWMAEADGRAAAAAAQYSMPQVTDHRTNPQQAV